MISRKFLTSSIVYTVSAALPTAASFLLLPYYTNTGLLSVSDFGALSLYLGLSLFVQVITNISLDFYVGVAYHELKDQPAELKSKLASLNGYLILNGLVITLFFFFIGRFFINSLISNAPEESFRYVMMSVLTGVFNAHFRFYNSHLINLEKPWRYFWANMLNFVTTVAFTLVILLKNPLTLEGPMWGRLLSCAAIFILSFGEVTIKYGIALHRRFLRPTWQFCYPLILTSVFAWVLAYSDRYIIKSFLFNKEVAVFDLAVRFTMLVEFLLSGLNGAMITKVYGLMSRPEEAGRQKELNKYYSGYNLIALLAIPLTILLLPIGLPLFLNADKYYESFLFIGIISAGMLTRSIQNIFVYPIHFFRKTEKLIWVNGVSAVIQLILGYLLIRYFGLYGAAFTLTIVKLVQTLLYYYAGRDLITGPVNLLKMVVLPVGCMLFVTATEMLVRSFLPFMHWIHLAELMIVALVVYLVYRREARELMRSTFASKRA